jgi:hypothetical protein
MSFTMATGKIWPDTIRQLLFLVTFYLQWGLKAAFGGVVMGCAVRGRYSISATVLGSCIPQDDFCIPRLYPQSVQLFLQLNIFLRTYTVTIPVQGVPRQIIIHRA